MFYGTHAVTIPPLGLDVERPQAMARIIAIKGREMTNIAVITARAVITGSTAMDSVGKKLFACARRK